MFGFTEAQVSSFGLSFGVGAFMLYMLFIIGELAWKAKAGRTGTIVLFFVLVAWCFTTIAAWFIILFTGEYPRGLYDFGVGALQWRLRVEAYLLLLVDEYPPFSLT